MKIINNNSGYTLIEMLVVIALIAIFSSFALINFKGNERQRNLNMDALKVLDAVSRVQNMSLVGTKIDNKIPDKYVFRYNNNLLCTPAAPCFQIASITDGVNTLYENIALSSQPIVQLAQYTSEFTSTTANNLCIAFVIPRGKMQFYSDENCTTPLEDVNKVTFTFSQNNLSSKILKIDKISGLLYINNE